MSGNGGRLMVLFSIYFQAYATVPCEPTPPVATPVPPSPPVGKPAPTPPTGRPVPAPPETPIQGAKTNGTESYCKEIWHSDPDT